MLNHTHYQQFLANGFFHVQNVFNASQIEQITAAVQQELNEHGTEDSKHGVTPVGTDPRFIKDKCCMCHWPMSRFLMSFPPLLNILRGFLGQDFLFMHEVGIHEDFYGPFHKDTASMENNGFKFHWKPNYLMIQLAIYLQDNDEHGGGIEIVPGSHLIADPVDTSQAIRVPSKAGDVAFFHLRANHRGAPPLEGFEPKKKYAIFFVCSANNEHADSYIEYLRSIPNGSYLNKHEKPADLNVFCREQGINIK